MCSTSCDCDGMPDAVSPTISVLEGVNRDVCKTCDGAAHVVLRKKDPYCVTCFLAASTHKFRSTLGKSKLVKPKQKILVAFSGGASSAAMVTLLLDGLAEDAHKRFLFDPSLVHVDDTAASSDADDVSAATEAVSLMSSSNLPFYTVPLELVVCPHVVALDPTTHGAKVPAAEVDGCRRTLASSFSSFKSATDRESFYKVTLRRLLLKLARDNEFDKVFTAETGTQLAAALLSTIALGRGSQLRDQASFVDDRDGRVKLLRPMREFTSEEVDLFNRHRHVTFRPPAKRAATASVARLTERFVNGLQRDFPATVSTIWRTGDKIAPPVRTASACSLCGSPLDTADVPAASAVEALRLTRAVSGLRVEGVTSSSSSELEECRELCYACQSLVAAGDRAVLKPLLEGADSA